MKTYPLGNNQEVFCGFGGGGGCHVERGLEEKWWREFRDERRLLFRSAGGKREQRKYVGSGELKGTIHQRWKMLASEGEG